MNKKNFAVFTLSLWCLFFETISLYAQSREPVWVTSPSSVYRQNRYVSAVGYGRNRGDAEKNALTALSAIFGQSIHSDFSTLTNYTEALKNGVVKTSDSTSVQNAIKTSTAMDSLIGAEIADVWQDTQNRMWYAVAVMDIAKTTELYTELLRANQKLIEDLTKLSASDKNSLDAFSRYRFAATIADANNEYVSVLSVIGTVPGDLKQLKKGNDYRLEAVNLAHNIPIAVSVKGDRKNRITNAFADVLADIGFKSGGNNNRYILTADVKLSETSFPGNDAKFSRYTLDTYLLDTANNSRIIPFSLDGREGHSSSTEAENRAVDTIVTEISEQYGEVFNKYFATTLLKK
ncbi:hypothetical protein AGMMS50212_06440 [Spirochaetia bacterium]|nr:hypothetical protein AGMMS50212_06310 [Spirochaetia bacterium]GHV83304.1 hypothetical protein AGMMS50212_06440 [Spirochaetia bacterium]